MIVNRKKIFRWAKIILFIYALVGIVLFYVQDKFLLHPKKLASNYTFKFDGKFEEMKIPFNEKDTMSLIKFYPNTTTKKGIVIYYHGNMDNVERYAAFTKPFTKLGYEVWMQDYPSFGKSTGDITEQKLYIQAMEVKRMADAYCSSDSIILYGKSIGTGIAAYVASNSKASLLVLETPYYSIPSLFATYAFIYPTSAMATYKIPTYEYLQDVKYPVVIFHGTKDGVIPYRNAKKLIALLKPTDKFITVPKANHLNINSTDIYYKAMDSLLKK
jgi:uncharacterized protein